MTTFGLMHWANKELQVLGVFRCLLHFSDKQNNYQLSHATFALSIYTKCPKWEWNICIHVYTYIYSEQFYKTRGMGESCQSREKCLIFVFKANEHFICIFWNPIYYLYRLNFRQDQDSSIESLSSLSVLSV